MLTKSRQRHTNSSKLEKRKKRWTETGKIMPTPSAGEKTDERDYQCRSVLKKPEGKRNGKEGTS